MGHPDLRRVVGRRGPVYARSVRAPSGDKAQSKLWFQDGRWWALMAHSPSGATQIHRLDSKRQVWVPTGVVVDERDRARGDVLWDGHKLYVASRTAYVSSWKRAPTEREVRAGSALLLRFSYLPDKKSYRLDPGFPAKIAGGSSESITLAKDSTGELWVTYTRFGRVFLNRTLGADDAWGKPFMLPDPAAAVDSDDTSAVIAFGGSRVGVLWSNQKERAFYFAVHDDAAADRTWHTEVAYGHGVGGCSTGCANDHISMRALPDGRLFAAVKTANRLPDQPFIVVLARDRRGWTSHNAGVVEELHTRPLIVLDDERMLLHLLTVVPEEGGAVYCRTTDINNVVFRRGLGTPWLSGGGRINNPSSTKQTVNSTSGLVVLASDEASKHYWYNTEGCPASG